MRLKKNGNTYYREVNLKISRSMIAKEAGVTPTTVSCVLNNTRPVSAKVRAKVMAAIEKLNYVPDLAARAMLGKGSKQIFVMVDSIKNPFFAELVYSMEEAGIQKGYFFSICGKMDMKTYVAHIIARKIDAVYFCSEIKNEEAVYVSQLLENGIRILTSPKFKHFEGQISRIDMATGEAARSAVRLLTAKGHTKIGFLNTFSDETQDDRLPLFRKEMLKNGLTPRCVPPDRTCFAGLESGRTLFPRTHGGISGYDGGARHQRPRRHRRDERGAAHGIPRARGSLFCGDRRDRTLLFGDAPPHHLPLQRLRTGEKGV